MRGRFSPTNLWFKKENYLSKIRCNLLMDNWQINCTDYSCNTCQKHLFPAFPSSGSSNQTYSVRMDWNDLWRQLRDACPIHYRWFFGKVPKGGGGVISDPKNFVAIFFALETALLVMNFRKNFEIGGGVISDPKNFVANSVLVVMTLEKIATFFPKRGGGGGSKAVWNISKNSSILVQTGFPKRCFWLRAEPQMCMLHSIIKAQVLPHMHTLDSYRWPCFNMKWENLIPRRQRP